MTSAELLAELQATNEAVKKMVAALQELLDNLQALILFRREADAVVEGHVVEKN